MKLNRKSVIKLIVLNFVLLFTSCTSCNKAPIPPKINTGYYFYCKVDGVEFNPVFKAELGYKNINAKLLRDSSLIVYADIGEQRVSIGLFNYDIIMQIKYILLKNGHPPGSASYTPNISFNKYETDSIHTGQVTFTSLDKSKQLVTGTFFFDAFNATTNDTVHITDGKFSLYYDTY